MSLAASEPHALGVQWRLALAGALLLSSALVYGSARDKAFVSGPYLVAPGAQRVTIRGFTAKETRWTVVPLSLGAPHGEEPAPTREHNVELTRLPLDRTVEVQVLENGQPMEGGRLRFRTDPGPTGAAFDFCVVGDSGGSPNRLLELFGYTPREGAKHRPDRIVSVMSAERPQLLLHVGDVVYPHGERENYARAFFRPFRPLIAAAPIAAAVGNHDLKTDAGMPFLQAFGSKESPPLSEGKYRSFDYGPLHVAVLNSNVEDSDQIDEQVKWLQNDLRTAQRPWKIAITHVPLYFSSDEQRTSVGAAQQRVCDALRSACEGGGVSVVFAGHHHWYERSKPLRGVVQIITGGGGDDIKRYYPGDFARAESYFHFVHARALGDVMTIRAIRETGEELEPDGGYRLFRRK
ncbi:MAG: metallophosphoesterase [Planctomycetes bacterium]|nr:metallophosphoesterase [Planctomycetota bacterium]